MAEEKATKKKGYRYLFYCPHCNQIIFKRNDLIQEIGMYCPKCKEWIGWIPLENIVESKIK